MVKQFISDIIIMWPVILAGAVFSAYMTEWYLSICVFSWAVCYAVYLK